MTKIKIETIKIEEKEGQFGVYYRTGIKAEGYEKWLNGNLKYPVKWKKDDEVDVEITENGELLNFKILTISEPKKVSNSANILLLERIEKLEKQVILLAEKLGLTTKAEKTEEEFKEFPEVDPKDLPF